MISSLFFYIVLLFSHIFRAALIWYISPSWRGLKNIVNGRRRMTWVSITRFLEKYFTWYVSFQSDWHIGAAIFGILIMMGYERKMGDNYPFLFLWLYALLASFLYNSIWSYRRGSNQGLMVTTLASFAGSLHVFMT